MISAPKVFRLIITVFALILCASGLARAEWVAGPQHAIAMHGTPKYGPQFPHFEYVNPNAPKGGTLRLAGVGTFDNLNPFIMKGQAAMLVSGLSYDTLMVGSSDEPFTMYGLVAKSIETPKDRSWVIFELDPRAKFADGHPILAEDVLFSLDILRTKGAPTYKFYYAGIDKAEALSDRRVKFTFKPGDNRELPLIAGQLPLLPKHYWQNREFDQTTLEPPLGSGPYRVSRFEVGRFIEMERNPDYWAKDHPTRKGYFNFDRIRGDYYRDSNVALHALKSGEYDFRAENEAAKWSNGYNDWQALRTGRAVKETLDNDVPAGMQAYVFNLRKPVFNDIRVREAIGLALDFEWTNARLFGGQYERSYSFWSNSELASSGLPQGEELKLLEQFKNQLPERVFTTPFKPPVTSGDGNIRPNLRKAMDLLESAGWKVENGVLVKDGRPLEFEILLRSPAFERITLPFMRNLERLGIRPSLRTVDPSQYLNRLRSFDFDMVVQGWGQSNSPGNEQANMWTSPSADQPSSYNWAGLKDPVVDKLVNLVIAAPDREQLVIRTRALDRVLLSHHFVVPQWYLGYDRVAYWGHLKRPEITPSGGFELFAWWSDPAQNASVPTPQTEGTKR